MMTDQDRWYWRALSFQGSRWVVRWRARCLVHTNLRPRAGRPQLTRDPLGATLISHQTVIDA